MLHPDRAAELELLRGVPILADLEAETLERLAGDLEFHDVPSGQWLFRAGDEADRAYVIVSGRLEVVSDDPSPRMLAVRRRGEAIGELAMLRGGRRTASVRAHRHAKLISVGREQFEELMHSSPAFSLALSRGLAGRVVEVSAGAPAVGQPRSFAVVGLDRGVDVSAAADALAGELGAFGGAVRMGPSAGEDWVGALGRLESEHSYVVVSAPGGDVSDPWTRFCLEETDRVVVLAGSAARPSEALRGCELVLVGSAPAGARADALIDALEPRSVRAVRAGGDVPRIMRELARRAAGRSVGLVLSGGGARAFCHLGVIEELMRAGVVIDRVAGVSLGALVAALLARGDSPDEIHRAIEYGFITHNPTNDYALPWVSLIRGTKTTRLLEGHFDSQRIEELAMPFACASTDLVDRRLVVHRTGSVWQAVRASLSIPGIFPPVRDRHGRLLVDGGVLDNLPLRATMAPGEGPVIAVDAANTSSVPVPRARGGWRAAAEGVLRRWTTGTAEALPPLPETIVRCMTLSSTDSVLAARRDADLVITPETSGISMLDWRRLDEMRAAGAAAARAALAAGAQALAV